MSERSFATSKKYGTLGSERPNALADARMMALQIPEARLESFWVLLCSSDSFWGCSITYTHKRAAFDGVDAATGRAKRLGAINTTRRELAGTLTGDAPDGEAAVEALKSAGFELRGKSAAIVGAVGGVGQAIVDALCANGVHQLTLREHDPARLMAAQNLVQAHWGVALCDTI